jgi:hypothetical protein
MTAPIFARQLLQQLEPERLEQLDQFELMQIVATIWADVELASILYGSEQFFWERLNHFARRGYLTAQEEQGTKRLLALSYRRQLQGIAGRDS